MTMGISLRFKAARPYLSRQAGGGGELESGWIGDLFFRLDFEDIFRIRLQASPCERHAATLLSEMRFLQASLRLG